MPWKSCYFEETNNMEGESGYLLQSGYREFPGVAPRWATIGTNTYGFSPGMASLSDSKMLQKMQEKKLKALDKMVDPPMNAPASMNGKPNTVIAGGINYIDVAQGQQSFTPTYQINLDPRAIEYSI